MNNTDKYNRNVQIYRIHLMGLTFAQIARAFSLDRSQVLRIVRKMQNMQEGSYDHTK